MAAYSWHFTMSNPVTCSVTARSTCSARLTWTKQNTPVAASTSHAPGLRQAIAERVCALGAAHAAPAAPHRRLDDNGVAEFGRDAAGLFVAADGGVAAGQDRHAGPRRDAAGDNLVPQLFQDFRTR